MNSMDGLIIMHDCSQYEEVACPRNFLLFGLGFFVLLKPFPLLND